MISYAQAAANMCLRFENWRFDAPQDFPQPPIESPVLPPGLGPDMEMKTMAQATSMFVVNF